ncbi:MAG: class I SAM-dependent methyltransferase [Spirochaetales bacterium]|nr:class I SAM-dependent methyltransferase [Spirochaetales bacterium]
MMNKKTHMDSVKSHFDINADLWKDLYHKFKRPNDVVLYNRKIISINFLSAFLKPGARVLDAGCGTGITGLDLVQRGFFVHGIDISSRMIDLCKQNFSQNNIDTSKYIFSTGNLVDVDFSENSFDAVLALGFLEYQKDEQKIIKIFQKIIRPGGILVCSGPAKFRFSNFFGLTAFLNSKYNKVSINRYSLSRFRKLLHSNGFTLLDHKQHGYADFLIINTLFGTKAEFLLSRVLTGILNRLSIEKFANDIIVVAENNC